MNGIGPVVPFRIDLSTLVRRSVASLYSHLVTRPTGQALRLGIESQICELRTPCVSVLDFSQVAVLDYSCADETVAKLILRFRKEDRPADAFFLARGVSEHHRDTLEAVLDRHGLLLVAEVEGEGRTLLGPVGDLERAAWEALEHRGSAAAAHLADDLTAPEPAISEALASLADHRVVLRRGSPETYYALTPLLAG
mgnify:CR=1 FL=1